MVILHKTVAELFDSLPTGHVLRTLCSIQLHLATYWLKLVKLDQLNLWGGLSSITAVKFGYDVSHRCRDIRLKVVGDVDFYAVFSTACKLC